MDLPLQDNEIVNRTKVSKNPYHSGSNTIGALDVGKRVTLEASEMVKRTR
jgi:hypothetical protein